jgi:predicted DNA-binding transcriptional regulator AlpA
MNISEAAAYLEVSRATVYRLIAKQRLAPIAPPNAALAHQRPRFRASDVYALRPDKAPHLDAAPPRLLAEAPPDYDPRG